MDQTPVAIARELLRDWLPKGDLKVAEDARTDALLVWPGPKGPVRFLVEFKKHLPQQDIQLLAHRLELLVQAQPKARTAAKALLLAPYIPPRQAEFLRGRGINYADETGNVHLDAPGILVHIQGKRPDRATTRGVVTKAWVRVTLAGLLNPALFEGPYRQLAAAAGVTPPTVMTCLRDLQHRGLLITRGRHRRLVDQKEATTLWTQAYVNVLRPRLTERRFRMLKTDHPEGILARVNKVLTAHAIPWCATGAAAALQLTHYYQTGLTEIYAPPRAITDPVARELRAQPTKGDADLILIEPPIPAVLTGGLVENGATPIAPALLAYAELRYHGTEQATDAAELLVPKIEGLNAPAT